MPFQNEPFPCCREALPKLTAKFLAPNLTVLGSSGLTKSVPGSSQLWLPPPMCLKPLRVLQLQPLGWAVLLDAAEQQEHHL